MSAAADNGWWMSSAGSWSTTAWLFVRGDLSVRLEARRFGNGFELVICGPLKHRRTLQFANLADLLEQQAQIEARLLAEGFTLHQFTSDRRRIPR